MTDLVHARVVEHLQRLRLPHLATKLDAVLAEAARTEPTYLDFLDGLLRDEMDSKQRKRIAMGVQIAHFPAVKTLDDFEFAFQPSLDQRLIREVATSRFVATGENVLLFGPPGVGKTHWPSPSGAPPSSTVTRSCSSPQRRSWGTRPS